MTQTEFMREKAEGGSGASAKPRSPVLRYEVDPTWPKTLPAGWTLGRTGGLSITAKDEIVICHRQDLTEEELEAFQTYYRKLAEAARSEMRESKRLPFAKARTAPPKGGSRPAGD